MAWEDNATVSKPHALMKTQSLRPTVLAATLFLTGAAWAQDTDEMNSMQADATAAKAGEVRRYEEILKRYDTNGDGRLDDAEKAEAKLGRFSASSEKTEKARGLLRDRARQFDKNNDGKLDAAERAGMERTMRARFEASPRALKRADTDGDGKLSDAEWAAVKEAMKKRRGAETVVE
jgi:Ca2+-binding EF-hand superfamily protein